MQESGTSVKFIFEYFILSEAIASGIIFLRSFSDCSLPLRRNSIEFCILTLYPATLPNSFITFKCVRGFLQIFFAKDQVICE